MKSATSFKFPDAGKIRCFDLQGREIPTPLPGEDLYGQNGCFSANPMSFQKLAKAGKPLADSVTWDDGYRMVRDNNTGLIWEVKSPGQKEINFSGDTYSWPDAQKIYIKKLNNAKYGGFSDWRLPNKDELRSIIDYSRTNPAVDPEFFPNTQNDFYWTSVVYKMQEPFVWGIFFGLGSGIPYAPTSKRYVRAVRGGADKSFESQDKTRFKDNADGTITDKLTGLMWQKEENERMDWYSALKASGAMKLGGFCDWRLPNIKELNTILNLSYENKWWYYKDFFPAKGLQPPLLHYFSSTPYEGIYVWVTNFCFGYDGYYASKTAKLLFRAVRYLKAPVVIPGVFNFPDSGQKKCYDEMGAIISVPKPGKRFWGQDGTYRINPLSFIKLREGTEEADVKLTWDQGLRMVKDNNTGLIWEVKSPHPWDINFKDNKYPWLEAQEYVELLNRKNFGGFTDWRLPHREELRTIVDYNGATPAVNQDYFEDCLPVFYWSEDPNLKDPMFAWGVYFAIGCAICYLKHSLHYVRAVRGGYSGNFADPLASAFSENGDGTVTDRNSGLMWKKDESPDMTWEEAMKYCQGLSLAGFKDWRLPTIKELATILDLSLKDGCWHHKDFFPNVKTAPLGFYWAATTYGDTFGWGVNFQFGYDGYYAGKRDGKYPLRPVRNIRGALRNTTGASL